jgi:ParB-like chromosome segregation protein Spo0J
MTERRRLPKTYVGRQWHPACLLLPEMPEDQFKELVEDIRKNGQREPIIIDENGIGLDGRNRDRACRELDITTEPVVFAGTEEEKIALIMSANIHRRHLTTDQRAAIAADLVERLKVAAEARQKAGKTLGSDDPKGKATEQAAKVVGVSDSSVKRAVKRKRTDPQAHEQAKAGKRPKAKPKAEPASPPAHRRLARFMPRVPQVLPPKPNGSSGKQYDLEEAIHEMLNELMKEDLEHFLSEASSRPSLVDAMQLLSAKLAAMVTTLRKRMPAQEDEEDDEEEDA